jgi:hypothetical protein
VCNQPCAVLSAALPRALRSRRVSAISCAFALWLMFIPAMNFAQSKPSSSPTSTTLTISQLKDLSTELVQRLTARIAESETLSAELVALKDKATQLQADLSETSTSLDNSKAALDKLQNDFDAYKTQSDLNIAAVEKERDSALIKAKIGSIGLKISVGVIAVAGGYELGRALKIWK